MKKIISSFLLGIILVSCTDTAKEKDKNQSVLQPIKTLVGIGKVLPKEGIIPLSISQTNQVVALYKKLGDSVKAGEVIFKMKAISQDLDVALSKANLKATIEKNIINSQDITIAKSKLIELERIFNISKKLQINGAETKQKVFLDSIAYVQQLQLVNQLTLVNSYDKQLVVEKDIQLKLSELNRNEQEFKALEPGVLIRFDVALGQVLSANYVFGELANVSDLVVEGELDELYASDIKIGQEVEVFSVGQNQFLAKGYLSFVGASLQNKSILYETIGEGSDRRVRRFTVTISNEKKSLLINQKVECKIKL